MDGAELSDSAAQEQEVRKNVKRARGEEEGDGHNMDAAAQNEAGSIVWASRHDGKFYITSRVKSSRGRYDRTVAPSDVDSIVGAAVT